MFQGVPIFKSSPQPHPAMHYLQSDLGSSRSMVFRNICLQKSPEGVGRGSGFRYLTRGPIGVVTEHTRMGTAHYCTRVSNNIEYTGTSTLRQ